jgi:hypothetical protein
MKRMKMTTYKCKICGKVLGSGAGAAAHLKTAHRLEPPLDNHRDQIEVVSSKEVELRRVNRPGAVLQLRDNHSLPAHLAHPKLRSRRVLHEIDDLFLMKDGDGALYLVEKIRDA